MLIEARQNPNQRVPINRGNSITNGLILLAPAIEKFPIDIVKNRKPDTIPSFVNRKSGLAMNGQIFLNGTVPDCNFTAGPYTVATFIFIDATPGTGAYNQIVGMSSYTSETVNTGWNLLITASNDASPLRYEYQSFNNTGFSSYGLLSTRQATIGEHCLAIINNGTNRYIYLDGSQEASTTSGLTTATTAANFSSGTASANQVYWTAVWKRALSDAEAKYLTRNPWCLFTQTIPD